MGYDRHGNLIPNATIWSDKLWINFGDSLTQPGIASGNPQSSSSSSDIERGTLYLDKCASEFGLTLDNRAIGGKRIYNLPTGDDGQNGIGMLDKLIASNVVPDLITIAYNGNVFSSTIGTDADTSEVTTNSTYGATKYFIEKIRQHYPNCIFAFVCPFMTSEANGYGGNHYYHEANEVTRELCQRYGVPYLDLENRGNIDITTDLTQDGVHPTSKQAQLKCYHAWRGFLMTL